MGAEVMHSPPAVKRVVELVCAHFITVFITVALSTATAAALKVSSSDGSLEAYMQCMSSLLHSCLQPRMTAAAWVMAAALAVALWLKSCKRPVMLLDFYTFLPPRHLGGNVDQFIDGMKKCKKWNATSEEFMIKVSQHSGLGDLTYFPEEIAMLSNTGSSTLKTTYQGAREETEMVLFGSVAQLLAKLQLAPHQIDAVIVNCSSFNPVPSLAACVINHFHMRPGVKAYTLSGMGCAASVIAVELAQELLQNHRNMRVLIASTENITNNLYTGAEKSMLITNCLFRLGGAAAVLSNRRQDKRIAKWSLQHIVRTHLSSDDAYNAVISHEDDRGHVGIKIGREVMNVAGRALTMNITALAPLILPVSEQIFYLCNLVARKVFKAKIDKYMPDFKTAVDHFAIHPGGKAVIDVVEKALSLQPEHAQPNRAAFERFGNTSSSSTWYALAWIETHTGVKRGDRLWQLAFGSGFKCASAIWIAQKSNNDQHDAWTGNASC